jgi:hypothetical protein
MAAVAAHIGHCGRCGGVMSELADARKELLGDDPAEARARAAARIMAEVAERKARRWRWRLWLPAGLVPVMGALALFALRPTAAPPESSTRFKGPLVLEAYCKRDNQVFPLQAGADFLAGDRLRFAYTKGESGYLMVFGVDDTGQVFPYYQDATLAGIEVRPGAKVMLPGSIELDGHHGWERVYALWSAKPLAEQAVRAAVTGALGVAGGDVRKADRLGVPAEQVSYLLRRP